MPKNIKYYLQITQPSVALDILQNPEKKILQNDLFYAIYFLFRKDFLEWITKNFSYSKFKDKLEADAKDAFQNGMILFFSKAQEPGFTIKKSLEKTIRNFCFLQLLAAFKKDKHLYGYFDHQERNDSPFNMDTEESFQKETETNTQAEAITIDIHKWELEEIAEYLTDAIDMLKPKQREIIILKFMYGLKPEQIAEKKKVGIGNIYNEISKAYKELKRLYKLRCN